MKIADKKKVAKYCGVNFTVLESCLRCLTELRNKTAHYSRLYFWIFSAIPQLPKDFSSYKDRSLFAQILSLKSVYNCNEKWQSEFLNGFIDLMDKYKASIVLKHIGFPSNWQDILSR